MYVGRTLLSAAFEFDFFQANTKIKGGRQECPPRRIFDCPNRNFYLTPTAYPLS
jgi:hypothetical protein